MNRKAILDAIRQNPERSVLIVGAGINGIGTFRDLALQGVDVLMLDRSDFCSGASAASSHMIHGGIRYLENGEFRLVREAVRERNLLLETAPHYVKPLPTTFPIFGWLTGLLNAPLKFLGLRDQPAERGAVVIKIGMLLYDAYTGSRRSTPRHSFMTRKQSLELYPYLNPDIVCTATYYDAAMPSPERLCIDLIRDAEMAFSGAQAINYLSVESAEGDTVTLRDGLTGHTLTLKPKAVINAAGPWIDLVNQTMGHEIHFIGGTKGSHIVLDHPDLRAAIGDHEFFFENDDGRIVLIFPLLDKVLVGTSDIRIENPDEAHCTGEEIAYFLTLIQKVFPSIEVAPSQIVFSFSGVRPLPSSKAGLTGQISRDHSVEIIEAGDGLSFPIYCLIGGKWTSFRAFSAQVTDQVLARLGRSRRIGTEGIPIGGGINYPRTEAERKTYLAALQEKTALPPERLEALLERYGTYADQVADFLAAAADEPLRHHAGYSRREIAFLAGHEKVVHLADLLLRRTLLAILGELMPALIEELAGIVGDTLAWSADRRQSEISRTVQILAERHGVTFS